MKKILIVEDDFLLSMINTKYIEMLGYKVVACVTNGLDAIEAVKEHSPDIVIMDVRIDGGMNGIEAMEEISKFSSTAVIYLTGNSEKELKERAAKTNMLAFCVKPVHFEELSKILKNEK